MTGYGIFYALLENDLRRVLAYSLINQVGFMVCRDRDRHRCWRSMEQYCSRFLPYPVTKPCCGCRRSGIDRDREDKGTELGGLYKTMPWTCSLDRRSRSPSPLSPVQRLYQQDPGYGSGGHRAICACIWLMLPLRFGRCVSPRRNKDSPILPFFPTTPDSVRMKPTNHEPGHGF